MAMVRKLAYVMLAVTAILSLRRDLQAQLNCNSQPPCNNHFYCSWTIDTGGVPPNCNEANEVCEQFCDDKGEVEYISCNGGQGQYGFCQCGYTRVSGCSSCTANGGSCATGSDCCSNVCGEFSNICGDMSPILIGLANNAANYHLTSAAGGVMFDIDADGSDEQVSWTEAGSDVAFLVLDRNGNSVIDNGFELFGNATRLRNDERARNGFEALAEFDVNGDHRIDSSDQVFASLRLWLDANHDGVSQPAELRTLGNASVAAVLTDYRISRRVDRNGNKYFYRGNAMVSRNGHETPTPVFDVILVVAH